MGQDKGGNLSGKRKRPHNKVKKKAGTPAAAEHVRAAKSHTSALFALATASNPNPKHLGPFSDRQRILVVGDGDLSFALALAVFLGGGNIVATCYDSKREAQDKYPNLVVNADALESAGAQVHFGVDGTALEREAWLRNAAPFHAVVFNFPHLGGATEEDVAKNQALLRGFFCSARPFLHAARGQVLVSLRNTLFYNRWRILEQARASDYKLVRTEPFDGSIYSGYEPQRTHPASFRGEPPSTTGAHYHIFAVDSAQTPKDPRAASTAPQLTASRGDATTHERPPANKPKSAQRAPTTASPSALECKVCATRFKDLKKYNAHINSAKHARKVKAQKKH
ncbi:hypothetical protein PybrP1_009911 [[Pythium] brassicae (nom. inval.)]|nr:hypothetical protein PybrP1_009911 [[Pythium] brassicae (nom. inval.)]